MSSEHAEQDEAPVAHRSVLSHAAGRILLLTILFTIVGVLLGVLLPSHIMPRQMSKDGHDAVMTVIVFTVAAAPVAAFVYAVGAYSLLRWRHRGNEAPTEDGEPIRGHGWVSGVWLTVSAILVIFVLTWGLRFLSTEQGNDATPLKVDVIGQQWVWSFKYPGTGVESSKLVLPVDRPVQFTITSKDVTHGFWPQEFGIQVDANPGEYTVIHTTPTKTGSFYVRCSQICGTFHAFMQGKGQVVTSKGFASWLEAKGATPASARSVAQLASGGGKS